ncbi:MAG: hypothetical protein ACI9OJ_001905 [Myxococcota bacterium]|jgi:hypothetical protein
MTESWQAHFSERRDLVAAFAGGDRFVAASDAAVFVVASDDAERPLWTRSVDTPVLQTCVDQSGGVWALRGDFISRWSADGDALDDVWLDSPAQRIAVRPDGGVVASVHIAENELRFFDMASQVTTATVDGPDSSHRLHALAWDGAGVWRPEYERLVFAEPTAQRDVPLAGVGGVCGLVATDAGVLVGDFEGGRVLRVDADGVLEPVATFSDQLFAFDALGDRLAAVTTGVGQHADRVTLTVGSFETRLPTPPNGVALAANRVAVNLNGTLRTWPV